MKITRFIIGALLLLVSVNALSAPVSRSRALDVAKTVFAAQPATKAAGDVKLLWDGEDIATKANVQPAFYVFGRERGGFVIIAGDDNVRPILAFSDDSPFVVEGMPDNVKWWMDQIKSYVRSAKTQSPEVARQWAGLVATKAKIDDALLDPSSISTHSRTVLWNQDGPANEDCPTLEHETEQSVCGCLPLALSEVMTWFGWPDQGVGSTSPYAYQYVYIQDASYQIGEQTMPAQNLEELTISPAEWAELQALDTYEEFTDCTDPIRSKLSKLVYYCGLLVKAQYSSYSTGATSSYVASLCADHMKYSRSAYRDFVSRHTISEWNATLKQQVLDHPVFYCGIASLGGGKDAGHAYVVDGYATLSLSGEDVFHFNFGWGGYCNGYYYSSYQDQRGEGTSYNFDTDIEALFDFVPDKTGTSQPVQKLVMASGSFYVNEDPLDDSSPVIIKSYIGLRAAEPIVKNKAIPLEVCYTNNSTSRYYGIVKLVLEHSDGTPIGDPLDIYDWGLAGGIPPSNYDLYLSNFPASTFTITQDFGFGDRLALYYTDDDSKSHFVRMGGAIDGSVIFELPVMPVPFIKVEDAYHPGDIFQFRLINYDKQYLGTKWTITDPDGVVSADLPQSQREFKFTKEGVYKIQAAIAEAAGDDAIENIVTYITVSNPMP